MLKTFEIHTIFTLLKFLDICICMYVKNRIKESSQLYPDRSSEGPMRLNILQR